MQIAQLNRWLGRFPTLKRVLVRIVARLPGLDMRLREAAYQASHPTSKARVDAARLPEEAALLHRRLKQGIARNRRA